MQGNVKVRVVAKVTIEVWGHTDNYSVDDMNDVPGCIRADAEDDFAEFVNLNGACVVEVLSVEELDREPDPEEEPEEDEADPHYSEDTP